MNPETGKSPKILKQINLAKTRQPFSAAEVKELGAVNDVLAKAKEVGGLSPRILT